MSDIALHDFDGDDGGSALSAGVQSPSISNSSGSNSVSIWNPANVVTCIRIALVPLFAAVALADPVAGVDFSRVAVAQGKIVACAGNQYGSRRNN